MSKKKPLKIIFPLIAVVIAIATFIVLTATHIICINHVWVDPTCTEPAWCFHCNKYRDNVLADHSFGMANCTEPKTCSYCNTTEGNPLGHKWIEATCEMPKTCEECGTTEGDLARHTYGNWELYSEPTLTEYGVEKLYCDVCGEVIDSRDTIKKTPVVEGDHFNFTDEEFIDWMNDTTNSTTGYSDLSDGDMGDNTLYRIEFDGEAGGFILNHGDNGKDGNVSAIMVWFDDWTTAYVIASFIGSEIDSRFVAEDAIVELRYGDSYTRGDLTATMLDLDDDFIVAVIAPNEFFEDILS